MAAMTLPKSAPFGEILAAFRVRRFLVLLYVLFGGVLLALGLAGCFTLLRGGAGPDRHRYPYLFSSLLCVWGCWLLRQAYLRARFRVLVCRDAVVRVQNGNADALPWQRIMRVRWEKNARRDAFESAGKLILEASDDGERPSAPSETQIKPAASAESRVGLSSNPFYRPQTASSPVSGFIFDGSLSRLATLRDFVEERTIPYLLPASLFAWQAGETIRFGDLGISRSGIHLSERLLPWNGIGAVRRQGDFIVVTAATGDRAMERIDVSRVPNAHVALALVVRAREGRATG